MIRSQCWCCKSHLHPQCVCVCVFTLDGDLGIGGGPPGLRVWLDASLSLCEWAMERERERWRAEKRQYRQITETVARMRNNVRERSSKCRDRAAKSYHRRQGMLYESPTGGCCCGTVMQEKWASFPSTPSPFFPPSVPCKQALVCASSASFTSEQC